MNIAIVLLVVLAILFCLAFFTKRRFGMLGLALAAGAVLADLWTQDLTPVIRDAGLQIVSPPMMSVVGATLILLPAIVLLFSGSSQKGKYKRIIGSAAFALLGLAFLLPVLGDALILEGDGREVFRQATDYHAWIITACLAYAVFDVLTTRSKKESEEKH